MKEVSLEVSLKKIDVVLDIESGFLALRGYGTVKKLLVHRCIQGIELKLHPFDFMLTVINVFSKNMLTAINVF